MKSSVKRITLKTALIFCCTAVLVATIALGAGRLNRRFMDRGAEVAGFVLIAIGCAAGYRYRGHPTEQYPRSIGAAGLHERGKDALFTYYLGTFGNTLVFVLAGGLLIGLASLSY